MRPLLLVLGGLVLAQSGERPLDDSQPPELTSDEGVGALRRRMSRHGRMLDDLALATLRLDHAQVVELAASLGRDTGLGAWPGADAGVEVRGSLSRLESELRARSRTLADVAARGADEEMPGAFGRLMEVCVRCHVKTLPAKPVRAGAPR